MLGRLVLLLSFASGALALTYEVLWTRHLLNLFGSTTMATSAMLAAFMVGMALGAWVMGQKSVGIRRPLMVYAGLELGLGIYGLAFVKILETASAVLTTGSLTEASEASAGLLVPLLGHITVLLVPTTLMGATLPVLAAALQTSGRAAPRSVAHIYGLNTLGGVIGAFVTGLWSLPTYGLMHAQAAAAVYAVVLAAAALTLDRFGTLPSISRSLFLNVRSVIDVRPSIRAVLPAALLLSGFAALGYEIIWTRVLVLVMGSSTYAFTMMLGTYLAGLALGGLWIGRYLDRLRNPSMVLQHLQLAVALAAVSGIAAFPYLPSLMLAGISNLGVSVWALGGVDFAIAVALVLVPTFFLGAALPVAARLMQRGTPKRGRELGTVLAWVSAGHVGGILGTSLVIIPVAGLKWGIVLLAGFNVGAAALLWLADWDPWARARVAVPVGIALISAVGWSLPPWNINIMTSGVFRQAPAYLSLLGTWRRLERAFTQYRSLFYEEGAEAVVAVFERPTLSDEPYIILSLDGKVDASTGADMKTQVLSGHLPLAFVPRARKALVVGLASGITVGALARHSVREIDVVEIERAVIEASRAFDEFSGAPLNDPRVTVAVEDGRQYLKSTGETYDIIVSEPSNPWLSSSARLFTREFFLLARERLTPKGVFVQWVPLYGLSSEQFRALFRTILNVFPNLAVFRAAESDLLVLASKGSLLPGPAAMERMFTEPAIRQGLARIGIRSAEELAAHWVADGTGLTLTFGNGPLNTDDNGLIEFGSPWYVLRDTRDGNNMALEQATAKSVVAAKLAANWTDRVDKIARFHLAAGRYGLARDLAKELRSRDRTAADILLGDLEVAEGNQETAEGLWRRQATPEAWIRLGEQELRRGNFQRAANFFARAIPVIRAPETFLGYGMALSALGDLEGALDSLGEIRANPLSIPDVVSPLIQAHVFERMGRKEESGKSRGEFQAKIDRLRARLESEAGQNQLNALLQWIDRSAVRHTPQIQKELQATVRRRLIGPIQTFYRGVSQFWLGDYVAAENALVAYLGLVEGFGGSSKGKQLLRLVRERRTVLTNRGSSLP